MCRVAHFTFQIFIVFLTIQPLSGLSSQCDVCAMYVWSEGVQFSLQATVRVTCNVYV